MRRTNKKSIIVSLILTSFLMPASHAQSILLQITSPADQALVLEGQTLTITAVCRSSPGRLDNITESSIDGAEACSTRLNRYYAIAIIGSSPFGHL